MENQKTFRFAMLKRMAGGRAIFPRLIELAHLVTSATAYDEGLREPSLERSDPDDRIGRRARRETTISCLGQINERNVEAMDMMLGGLGPQSDATITFHYNDLMDAGLIGDDGDPLVRINDRLLCVRTADSGRAIYLPQDPPGLFIVEARPASFGFGADAEWNLLKCRFMDRELGSSR